MQIAACSDCGLRYGFTDSEHDYCPSCIAIPADVRGMAQAWREYAELRKEDTDTWDAAFSAELAWYDERVKALRLSRD